MSHKNDHSALQKEFELERVILFSDAVFAIAITLLVIDIKFPEYPEGRLSGAESFKLLKPTIFSFLAFAASFFFIGHSWATHLKLFRLLRKYDQGLIKRNLAFLFFIVLFPFTASVIAGHFNQQFMLPLFLYMFNLTGVSITHYVLCRYALYSRPQLSVEGAAGEKKFFYIRSLYNAISFTTISVAMLVLGVLFPDNGEYLGYACAVGGVTMAILNNKAKKYKAAANAAS